MMPMVAMAPFDTLSEFQRLKNVVDLVIYYVYVIILHICNLFSAGLDHGKC